MFVSWSSVHYFLVAKSDDPTSIPDGDSPGVAVVSCSPSRAGMVLVRSCGVATVASVRRGSVV